jgi:hypothetical protein
VHDFVRDTLRERLMESRPAPAFSPAPRPQGEAASSPAAVQPAAELPYSEFSQMIEDVGQWAPSEQDVPGALNSGQEAEGLPNFALRPTAAPPQRLDFSAPPL